MIRVFGSKNTCSLSRSSFFPYYLNPIKLVCFRYSTADPELLLEVKFSRVLRTGRSNQVKSGPRRRLCQVVLDHFDKQYNEELGELWTKARAVLLDPPSWQYGLMLNRFTELGELSQALQAQGFYNFLPGDCESGSLRCLVHPAQNRFPSQKHRVGLLKKLYLLNAASLLPVLALGVQDGDRVLDLCSAPGGKAVAILQSATPGLLHCNEWDGGRRSWLRDTLQSFIPPNLMEIVQVLDLDGRFLELREAAMYDKVLVDAPCSNDRSWLHASQPEQAALWLQERGKLPELQRELLSSALAVVRPGGTVVYCTCTLSRAENSTVVEEVLASSPSARPQDLGWLADALSHRFTFAPDSPHGLLVVPQEGRTWGPMYLAKLRKV